MNWPYDHPVNLPSSLKSNFLVFIVIITNGLVNLGSIAYGQICIEVSIVTLVSRYLDTFPPKVSFILLVDNQHSVAPYPGQELEEYPSHPHGNLILAWSDVANWCVHHLCYVQETEFHSYLCNIVLFNFPFVFIYLDFKYIISVFDNFRRTQFIVSVLTSTSFLFSFKSSWFFYPNRTSNMFMSCLCYLLKFVRFTSNYYIKEKWFLKEMWGLLIPSSLQKGALKNFIFYRYFQATHLF